MNETYRIPLLVIGGGIGGLATALALSKQGYAVHLIEKAPQFGEIGAGIQIAPNASRVLDHLGILDEISKYAVYPHPSSVRLPRTARVQQAARIFGEICHIDGIGIALRNTILAQRAYDDFTHIDWLYGYAAIC